MLICGLGICTGTAGQTALSCADGSIAGLLQAVGTDIFYFYFYFFISYLY
jgi:hypothetical protein